MKEGRLKNLNRGFQTTFVLAEIACVYEIRFKSLMRS